MRFVRDASLVVAHFDPLLVEDRFVPLFFASLGLTIRSYGRNSRGIRSFWSRASELSRTLTGGRGWSQIFEVRCGKRFLKELMLAVEDVWSMVVICLAPGMELMGVRPFMQENHQFHIFNGNANLHNSFSL